MSLAHLKVSRGVSFNLVDSHQNLAKVDMPTTLLRAEKLNLNFFVLIITANI